MFILRHQTEADRFGQQKKPYSAVTVQIDRLTSEQFEEDDYSGIPDLIEVVRIQASGPTEAARAIRKKLYVVAFDCDRRLAYVS